jgi:flagellar motor switch protein FliM
VQNDAPLLSDAETSALLEAMRGAQNAVPPAAAPLDLIAADRPLRDALLPADRAADGFAQQIVRPLLRQLGVACTAEPEPAEITPFDVFRASISAGAVAALISSESGASAFLTIGPSLAAQVLDRRLGAPPKGAGDVLWLDGPEPTLESLSSVDCRILRPFVDDVLTTFAGVWCTSGAKVELQTLYQRADQLAARSRSEPLLRMSWRAAPFGQRGDRIEVAMTAPFLHDTHPPARAARTPIHPGERTKILHRIQGAPIRVAARLGSCPATVRELLALSSGDVLRLDTVVGAPIALLAGSRPVATGQPVVEHGNLAVEIVEVLGRNHRPR